MIVIRWHHFTVRHFTHTPVKYTFALKAQELAQHLELFLYNCISLIFNTFSEVCHFFTQIGVSHLLRETSRLLTKLMRTLDGALSCTLGVAQCLLQESFFNANNEWPSSLFFVFICVNIEHYLHLTLGQ